MHSFHKRTYTLHEYAFTVEFYLIPLVIHIFMGKEKRRSLSSFLRFGASFNLALCRCVDSWMTRRMVRLETFNKHSHNDFAFFPHWKLLRSSSAHLRAIQPGSLKRFFNYIHRSRSSLRNLPYAIASVTHNLALAPFILQKPLPSSHYANKIKHHSPFTTFTSK
jgi:hypothetical protein